MFETKPGIALMQMKEIVVGQLKSQNIASEIIITKGQKGSFELARFTPTPDSVSFRTKMLRFSCRLYERCRFKAKRD